jgi:hypothetical protein
MTARTILIPLSALTFGLLLAAACGGNGGTEQPPVRLTDPRSVPTATPWPQPPEPIILEPGALTPIGQDGGEEDGATGDGGSTPTASGECGDVYIVEAGDAPFSIAQKCGVDVNDLLELNGIDDPTSLFVGQELKIPQ